MLYICVRKKKIKKLPLQFIFFSILFLVFIFLHFPLYKNIQHTIVSFFSILLFSIAQYTYTCSEDCDAKLNICLCCFFMSLYFFFMFLQHKLNAQVRLSDEQEKDIKTMEKVNYELFMGANTCKKKKWKETTINGVSYSNFLHYYCHLPYFHYVNSNYMFVMRLMD